jgi:ATP-dependent protease HslVU (ClpYQ) peptidase subunit
VTCIVSIKDPATGKVVMGGDSAGVGGFDISIRSDPKVFQNGAFLFGICGSFRMGQLLHHTFVPPAHPEDMDDYKFMVTEFVDAVRACFDRGGYLHTETGEDLGGTFLVAYNGNLYRVDDDFQVGIPAEGFVAVGCGDQIAHGALFATHTMAHLSAEARVEIALEAAAWFSAGVRPPFVIMEQQPGQRSNTVVKSRRKRATAKTPKAPAKKRAPRKKKDDV